MIQSLQRAFLQKKGHGFSVKETEKAIDETNYTDEGNELEAVFGGKAVIRPDGQWDDFLPKVEIQKFAWGDTYHCTVYGSENMVQTLMKAKYGEVDEYTERYLGVLAGIRNNYGGSPHAVLEAWRKNGNLPYEKLPFEDAKSYSQFNSPKPMTNALITEAKKWLEGWKLGHQWIWNFRHSNLKELLKYSPLGIGVYAWSQSNGKYIKPSWARDNHWVEMYGYVEGSHWKVYDHYDNVHKKLDWNYPFAFAKSIDLEKLKVNPHQEGKELHDRLQGKLLLRPHANGELYRLETLKLTKVTFEISDKQLFADVQKSLTELNVFTGLTEDNYNLILEYIKAENGQVTAGPDTIIGLIELIKDRLS